MGNLKEKALKESQKIVENLIVQTPQGKTFQFESFIQGLGEEIEDFWSSETTEGLACFHLVESGDLVYEGLTNHSLSINNPTNVEITFALKEDANLSNVSEEQLDVFTLLSSMKEAHYKEKSRILESLDQISIDFDKKLIETIKKTKTPNTTKIAEEYLNLDIATKKQKLLEKLLEGK